VLKKKKDKRPTAKSKSIKGSLAYMVAFEKIAVEAINVSEYLIM